MLFTDYRAIDLTLTIDERLPSTWPPHVPFVRRTWNYFEEQEHGSEVWTDHCGPYFTEVLIIDEHIATHFDAPSHMVPEHAPHREGGINGDQVAAEQFVGNAVVIDVTALPAPRPGESSWIGIEHIEARERELGRRLSANDVVLFRSDWDVRHYRPFPAGNGYAFDVAVLKKSPGWPAPTVEAITLLVERGVRCVGTDGPSMGAAHDGIPAHIAGLSHGQVFIEGLANLGAIPDAGATFQFLPIKVARSSGGPGRAVAWVPRDAAVAGGGEEEK